MKTIQVTVTEYKNMRGIKTQVEANTIIKMLAEQGIAKKVGKKKKHPKAQGQPSVVWEIPANATIKVFDELEVPEDITINTVVASVAEAVEVEG
jgi:hypothetical protein